MTRHHSGDVIVVSQWSDPKLECTYSHQMTCKVLYKFDMTACQQQGRGGGAWGEGER